MLGKLLKHEFGQTARTLLPIFGGTTVTLLLAKLMIILNHSYQRLTVIEAGTKVNQIPALAVLSALISFLFFVMLAALVIGTMLVVVQRFYRILGDEGYTMFALPVTPAQHIWAKTICGITWMVAAIVFLLGSVSFLVFTGNELSQAVVDGSFIWNEGAQGYLWMALLVLCMIAGIWAAMWQAYLACAVGARFGQYRLVASIGAFFVIQTIFQILAVGMLFLVSYIGNETKIMQLLFPIEQTNPVAMLNVIFAILLGVLVVCGTVFYALMHHNLTKKLNLA